MFCQHQTYANFARVDQFSTINKIAINTHDPCHNTIVRSQKVNFSADLAFAKVFYGYWLCTNGFVSTSMYMDLIPPPTHTHTVPGGGGVHAAPASPGQPSSPRVHRVQDEGA